MNMLLSTGKCAASTMVEISEENGEVRQTGKTTTCWKCGLVCKNRQGLSVHQNKCLSNAVKGASFFRDERLDLNRPMPRKPSPRGEKVIPASQPLTETNTEVATNEEETISPIANEVTTNTSPETDAVAESIADGGGDENAIQSTTPLTEIPIFDIRNRANLPEFIAVNTFASKEYNNIDGQTLTHLINKIYEDVVTWKKNFFLLPTGQCGKEYIKLTTEWIQHLINDDASFKIIAMKVVMILPSMLLQKPSATSKAKDHSKALEQRLAMWKEGKFEELWKDSVIIQRQLTQRPKRTGQDITRIVTNLMFEGKVGAAMKFLDENAENAVLQSTPQVIQKLRTLHPEQSDILPNTLYQGPLEKTSHAHFNNINEQEILKAAQQTKGSGGPSLLDAKQWKRMLCSGHFKVESKELRVQLALFAKKIATEVLDLRSIHCISTNTSRQRPRK